MPKPLADAILLSDDFNGLPAPAGRRLVWGVWKLVVEIELFSTPPPGPNGLVCSPPSPVLYCENELVEPPCPIRLRLPGELKATPLRWASRDDEQRPRIHNATSDDLDLRRCSPKPFILPSLYHMDPRVVAVSRISFSGWVGHPRRSRRFRTSRTTSMIGETAVVPHRTTGVSGRALCGKMIARPDRKANAP